VDRRIEAGSVSVKLRSATMAEELHRLKLDAPRLERGAVDARAIGATGTADVMEQEASIMRRRIAALELALPRQIAAEDQHQER